MDQYQANLELSRYLRKNATDEENNLWYKFLHNYPIRMYRQYRINRYIVDFYCKKAKLAIEIDGEGHYTEKQINHDRARTQILNKSNIEVIRFSNIEVNKKFKTVCRAIDLKVRNKLHIKDD